MEVTMKSYANKVKQTLRREKVFKRLTAQLENGVKPDKQLGKDMLTHTIKENNIPLTEHDIKRIKRELVTLKQRTI